MVQNRWFIPWSGYTSTSYTYGSEISFLENGDVEYENLLMPPGTVINSWKSRTNFQMERLEPTLPIMDGESAYRITVNMDFEDEQDEDIMIRIQFFDRYDEKTSAVTLRGRENCIKPPIQTYSYTMELINGGIHKFRFHNILLEEIKKEEYESWFETLTKIKKAAKKGKTLRRTAKKPEQ